MTQLLNLIPEGTLPVSALIDGAQYEVSLNNTNARVERRSTARAAAPAAHTVTDLDALVCSRRERIEHLIELAYRRLDALQTVQAMQRHYRLVCELDKAE